MTLRGSLALLCVPALIACSGSDGSGEPPESPVATTQDEWDEAAFQAATDGDADVAALRAALAGAGFATFVTAGRLADDAAVLEFGAWADASGTEAAVVRHCAGTDCVRAIARLGDLGAVRWEDAAGQPVPVRPIAIPPLLREVVPGGTADATKVVSALEAEFPPLSPDAIDLSARRLVVAGQFGADLGLAAADLATPFAGATRFTSTVLQDRVSAADLERFLQASHSQEVLVVAAQPVRQLRRQDPAGNWYKTLGIETARGIYGFRRIDADRMAGALRAAPFGGPGLVLLVGSESLGDDTEEYWKITGSIPLNLRFPGKVVAGFLKGAPPAVLAEASRRFLARLEAGDTAAAARDAVNATLEAWGVEARLGFTIESDEEWRLPGPRETFWGGKPPVSGTIDFIFFFRKHCAASQWGSQVAVEDRQVPLQLTGLTWDGPVFRATRVMEDLFERGVTERSEVVGLLDDLRVGGHFHLVFQGDVRPGYRGLTLYGNARVQRIQEVDGKRVLSFDGRAEALPYDDEGTTCTLPDTELAPLIDGTETFGALTLTY